MSMNLCSVSIEEAWRQATEIVKADEFKLFPVEDIELLCAKYNCNENQKNTREEHLSILIEDTGRNELRLQLNKDVESTTSPAGPVAEEDFVHIPQDIKGNKVEVEKSIESMDIDIPDEKCNTGNEDSSFCFSIDSDDDVIMESSDSSAKSGINICILNSILEKGMTATSAINKQSDVVMVLGATGSGKSTFIQAVAAGKQLSRSADPILRKSSYVVAGDEIEGFEIGHGLQSQTPHVRSYFRQDTSTYYVDSSGFGDTKGIETDIATSICVQEIAQRTGKLRFVFLINTFQFYSDRATELRKSLEVVSKFIGHNFADYQLSFTFLFTHCSAVFDDVKTLIASSADSKDILKVMRDNIGRLLAETKRSTSDHSTLHLIKFLRASIVKGYYGFCDVFDPIFSNLEVIRHSIEPITAKSCITDPAQIVNCSLTASAKMRLDHEIKNRINTISNMLRDWKFDDDLWQEVCNVCHICSNISNYEDIIKNLSCDLESSKKQLQNELRLSVETITTSNSASSDNEASAEEAAKNTKQYLEWFAFLRSLTHKCFDSLNAESNFKRGEEIGSSVKKELLAQLLVVIGQQATIIEAEFPKMLGFLNSQNEIPNLGLIGNQYVKILKWAGVFKEDIGARIKSTENIVHRELSNLIKFYDQGGTMDTISLLRFIELINNLVESPWKSELVRTIPLETLNQKHIHFLCITNDKVNLFLLNLSKTVSKAFIETPTKVLNSRDSNLHFFINNDLNDAMHFVDTIHAMIMNKKRMINYDFVDPWWPSLQIALSGFIQRVKVFHSLLAKLDMNNVHLIHGCWTSLHVFIESLPNSMKVAENGFVQELKNVNSAMKRKVDLICEKVSNKAMNLLANKIEGDPFYCKRDISVLKALAWTDSSKMYRHDESNTIEHMQISSIVNQAFDSYANYTRNLSCSIFDNLSTILDGKVTNRDAIQSNISCLLDNFGQLHKVFHIVDEKHLCDEPMQLACKLISEWSGQRLRETLPDSVVDLEIENVDINYFITKKLETVDSRFEKLLANYASYTEDKMVKYRSEIQMTLECFDDLNLVAIFLNLSRLWSSTALVNILPSYDNISSVVNKNFNSRAAELNQTIKDTSNTTDLKDVENRLQSICCFESSLKIHLDASNKSWIPRLYDDVERLKVEIDNRFKGFIEDHDYTSIHKHLEQLQKEMHEEQFRKCMRALSCHLKTQIRVVRNSLEASSPISIDSMRVHEAVNALKDIQNAENILGNSEFILPPVLGECETWKLDGTSKTLNQQLSVFCVKTIKAAGDAARNKNYMESVLCIERSRLLQQVVKKHEKALVEAEKKVNKLFAEFDNAISTFLDVLTKYHFPPNTNILLQSLTQMKKVTMRQDCPSKIQTTYKLARQILSEGLDTVISSLKSEQSNGHFKKSIKVLTFLKKEMTLKGLEDHLECSFDISEELNQVVELSDNAEEEFRPALWDTINVDRIAAKLNEQSKSWLPSWFNDYETNRVVATKHVHEFLNETRLMIGNYECSEILERVSILGYIDDKMGNHLTRKCDIHGTIFSTLQQTFSRLCRSMETALCYDFDNFETVLFTKFSRMVEGILGNQSDTSSDMFKELVNICQDWGKELDCTMTEHTKKVLNHFKLSLKKHEYDDIPSQVENLKSIGFFLIGPFQTYRKVSPFNNSELVNLINERFAIKKVIDIGNSLSILELGRTTTKSDVRKAFRKLSLIWHPDKNTDNQQYATEMFRKLKSAYDLLQADGNMEFYQSYDFLFLSKAVDNIPNSLEMYTKTALNNRDFQSVTNILMKANKISAIGKLLKDPPKTIGVQSIRDLIQNAVKGYAHGLTIDIKKAHTMQDFVQLHHLFANLEEFESHFKSNRKIMEASFSSSIIKDLKESMEKMQGEALFLQGATENNANKKLEEFAMKLIQIGRILDGFPRLKLEAQNSINFLLNTVDKEPWGVSFIFKLGLLLEAGELSSGNDEEKRIGRVIVGTMPHFNDVRTVVFNREVITADTADSISKTKSQRCVDGAILKDISLDRNALKNECEIYEKIFHESFAEFVQKGHDDLVRNVCAVAKSVGSCSFTNWDNSVKSKITEILAGVFATFTIIKSGESFLRFISHDSVDDSTTQKYTAENILFCPHNIQIIAILRLLGIGTSEKALPNHIMEVRTGEGKSIILGALAVVLSLLGFNVRCVCYSEHLSERDNELFNDIFIAFGVAPRIKYSKITTTSEEKIAEKGDIRGLTVDLVKGNTVKKTSFNKMLKGAPSTYDTESSSLLPKITVDKEENDAMETRTLEILSDCSDLTNMVKRSKESCTKTLSKKLNCANSVLPLNGEEVLLVDEVDVFFGPDFYGKTYNQVSEIHDPTVEKLMRKIWAQRSSNPSFSLVSKWVEYIDLLNRFTDWPLQIETEVKKMCGDVNGFNEPPYEVDTINSRLGYSHLDSVDWDQTFGYRTAFAHLFEGEMGKLVGSTADAVIRKSLCLRISCGQFSYANIQPNAILGVSGTLRVLSLAERTIIQDFGVDTFSFVPSVYGPNNLSFDKVGRGIMIECDKTRHLQEIANAMKQAISNNRSAIAFFENDLRLIEFQKSSYWGQFRHANALLSTVEKETRKYIINKAATSKQVTIASAAFGRGTDFFCKDSKLENSGGMLVVQTFLSEEKSEELQIQGRTARQGKKGSYQMIILDSDLEHKFDIKPDSYKSLPHTELYNFLDQQRQRLHAKTLENSKEILEKAEERDLLSRSYLNCLICGDTRSATKYLNSLYEDILKNSNQLKFCRLVCLSDATSSMNGLWDRTRNCIKEMLQRIEEIGRGKFELLWIAYRDYSDGQVIQKSNWSKDPMELSKFVNAISTSGGGDYEEAVELAMKEANDEHEKEKISRVILIGDAPPHYEGCGNRLGGHNHVLATDYKKETKRFKQNDIPVYTFRLSDEASLVTTFKHIADETGGESHRLDIGDRNSNKLIDIICENALEEIGGSELVAEYRARHVK